MTSGLGTTQGLTYRDGSRVHGVSGEAERSGTKGRKPKVKLLARRTEVETAAQQTGTTT